MLCIRAAFIVRNRNSGLPAPTVGQAERESGPFSVRAWFGLRCCDTEDQPLVEEKGSNLTKGRKERRAAIKYCSRIDADGVVVHLTAMNRQTLDVTSRYLFLSGPTFFCCDQTALTVRYFSQDSLGFSNLEAFFLDLESTPIPRGEGACYISGKRWIGRSATHKTDIKQNLHFLGVVDCCVGFIPGIGVWSQTRVFVGLLRGWLVVAFWLPFPVAKELDRRQASQEESKVWKIQ